MSLEDRQMPPEMIPELLRAPEVAPSWPVAKPPRRLLHLGLLLATVVTTVIAGALQQGVNPFATRRCFIRASRFPSLSS